MSQSPHSRAIRDLEPELGVVLFVRTTRRVEPTALERARPALAEIDGAIAAAQRSSPPDAGLVAIARVPFSGAVAARLAGALAKEPLELSVRIEEEITPESLRRVGGTGVGGGGGGRMGRRGLGRVRGGAFRSAAEHPIDLVSRWPASDAVDALVPAAQRGRDAEGWLTERTARTELPED